MQRDSVIQRAFAGGELSPSLHARADQVKYATGLRTCRNFLVQRSGGVTNRAGLRYIATCKTPASASVKLLRYVSEVTGESLLLEHGLGYFRFYKNGAAVTVSGVAAWDVATPYVQGDLVVDVGVNYYAVQDGVGHTPASSPLYWYPLTGAIYEVPAPQATHLYEWTQSGRTITLTSPDAAPCELTFRALTDWVLSVVTTTPSILAPSSLAGVAGAAGARTYAYVVTAARAEDYEESNVSNVGTIASCAEPTPDAPNTLSWTAVVGAAEYYVYLDAYGNGVYGYVGTAAANAFNDVGFVPDVSTTPPIARSLFDSTNNYPAVAGHYQQRRFFAYTNTEPDAIYASRVGFPSNFGISSPLQDDDALTFKIAGGNHHPVRFLLGLKQLIVLTDAGVWTIGLPKVPLTPSDLPADQETYVGTHDKKPVIIGNTLVYVQARGNILRDLRFDQSIEGFAGRDLTIFADHLLRGRSISRIDYAHAPDSIVWVTHGGSSFLGLTYIPEHEIWGWHRHDSHGASFDDVCVVPESTEDVPYFIVKRTIGGNTVYYIEQLESRTIGADTFDADVFFVDCGLSYSGAPAHTFTGLAHLNGEVVAVVGDGAVVYNGDPAGTDAATYTVSGGSLTLTGAYSNVHIGLARLEQDFETLDLDVQGSNIRDKRKKVPSVTVLIERSARTFKAGPDAGHLLAVKLAPWEGAADESTGAIEVDLTGGFDETGRVFIRHSDPLPLTILGIIPNVDLGG